MSGIVAVTGAAGFLGRRLVARFAEAGFAVRAFARRPERIEVPAGASVERHRWLLGDALSLGGVDALVHAAAFRPPPGRYGDLGEAGPCFQVNAVGTADVTRQGVAAGVGAVVIVSAGNVYRPLDRPAREDDPFGPSHRAPYYLTSKIAGELLAMAVGEGPGARVVALRPSAIYGPEMPPGLVPTLVAKIGGGGVATLEDGGRYTADLVYVDDVADAAVAAVRRPVRGAYNVGGGALVTALALARTVAGLAGRGDEAIEVLPPSPSAPPGFTALDIGRARTDLDYRPRPVADGLRAMVPARAT